MIKKRGRSDDGEKNVFYIGPLQITSQTDYLWLVRKEASPRSII